MVSFRVVTALSAVPLVLSNFDGHRPVLDDDLIASVNALQPGWTAARNERFEGLTLMEAKGLLGSVSSLSSSTAPVENATTASSSPNLGRVPLNFDSRTQWPDCDWTIRDQKHCGACWAFGAAEVLSDRFCIASEGKIKVTLSPQDLISCDVSKYTMGCDGGVPEYAWHYMEKTGISSVECIPYIDNATEKCPSKCSGSGTSKKYKVVEGSTRLLSGAVGAAQQDLFQTGPIQVGFLVYQDFFAYKSGIYRHTSGTGKFLGKHSVKIVGYGQAFGEDYWTVANSWGPKWGDNGYFKIVRSSPDGCGIENEMVLGQPSLDAQNVDVVV